MNIGINEARPPYAQFFTRAIEDRNATIEAGHMVYKDVDMVAITPQGSKDKIERVADEWLAHIRRETQQERFDERWLVHYERCYRDFKEGKETPVEGTSILNWPSASPAQVKTLIAYGIRTVEDLAIANEETISRLGMGGRALKDKASAWISTSNDIGKVSERLAALESECSRLTAENAQLTQNCAALNAQVKVFENAQGSIKGSRATKPASQDDSEVEFN